MNKSMRRTLLLLLIAFTTCLEAMADRGGFRYTQWLFEAQVSAKNEWTIHEVENVYFDAPRHGIYRYIPLDFYAQLNIAPDGKPQRTPSRHYYPEIEITSTSGAEVCIYDDENDNRVIRFGQQDIEITGPKQYAIDYKYTLPDDRIDARDFIYYTVKPDDINEEVETFSFDLQFEKPLPDDIANRLKIFIGPRGKTTECQVIDDQVITPTRIKGVIRNINPGEAITLYAELPQGYWEDTRKESPFWSRVFCWLSLVLGAILLFLELTRRYDPVVKTVEFYAPDDITPSEVGVIIDDSSDIIDLTALVPWLAQRGYLKIKEVKKSGILTSKTDIELTKIKDLPADAPVYQQRIMEMLFPDGGKVQLMSELGHNPKKVKVAREALADCFKGDRKLVTVKGTFLASMLMLASTLALGLSDPARVSGYNVVAYIFIWLFPFAIAYYLRIFRSPKDIFRSRAWLICCRLLRLIPFVVQSIILVIALWDSEENLLTGIELVSLVLLCFVVTELSQRLVYDTLYRDSVKGRLLGFKEFIETAEKDRLQMLVDEDPEYFYKVLPYAMVFEQTNKWVDQFKNIDLKEAEWYHTDSVGSFGYINSLSTNLNRTVNDAITTSSHSESSGSSGGGGGFSGGGGGGGGGGSW